MWVKLDDNFLHHRKILVAGQLLGRNGITRAVLTYIEGLCYAARYLTDGFLPLYFVQHIKNDRHPLEVAKIFIRDDVLLWHTAEGGFQIHDYLDYNPSSSEIKDKRAWDSRRKALYSNPILVQQIRARDLDLCRYCGCHVNWHDRRGP